MNKCQLSLREISQDSGGLLLDISGYSMYSIMIVIFYKMLFHYIFCNCSVETNTITKLQFFYWDSQLVLVVENLLANARDMRDASLIPGFKRSPGAWHCNALQYSCLENPMDIGAWQATVHRGISLKSEKGIISYFIFLSKG